MALPSWFLQMIRHAFLLLALATCLVPGSKVSERHPDPDQGLVGPGKSEEVGGGAQQCGDQ